jgi:hypothetical protein
MKCIYLYLDPFQMNMMLTSLPDKPTNMTSCNTTRASDLAADEQLRRSSAATIPQETAQAWGSLHGFSSCSVFLRRLLQSWPIRTNETVCLCSSSSIRSGTSVWDFNAKFCSFYCFCCPSAQLLPSLRLLIAGKRSHQTGMAMIRAETSGSG